MSKTKQDSIGDLSAYERWELPALGGLGETPKKRPSKPSAPKIKLPTAADIEKIREAAYKEGFAQGKDEGYQAGFTEGLEAGKQKGQQEGLAAGLDSAKVQVAQKIKELSNIMGVLAKPIAAQEETLAQALVNTSVAIARSVIHRELQADSSVINDCVTQVLAQLNDATPKATLYVNPLDYELAAQALDESVNVQLFADQKMLRGGCRLESDRQLIDYSVEKRFQKIVQGMLASAARNQSDQGPGPDHSNVLNELSDYSGELLDEPIPELPATETSPNESALSDAADVPEDEPKGDESASSSDQ